MARPDAQWKSTRGGSSRIEGYGGGWGASREIAKYIYFLSHRYWNWLDSPTRVIFSTLNLQNQIYTSKWYNNYNIALRCGMYRGLIFLLRSSNFFLPFTCLCPFFWSVVIPRSLPLWTWLFSSLGALCLFLSGSLSCLLDLLLGSASPLVLVPWFLWPKPHALLLPDGFIVLCNMWVDFATVVDLLWPSLACQLSASG